MIPETFITGVGIDYRATGVSYLSDLYGDLRRTTFLFIRDSTGSIQSSVTLRAEEACL
jgi:hypothetical protein